MEGFPSGRLVKNLPAIAGDTRDAIWFLDPEDPLEKEMATHSSTFAWEIPRTEETGRLQSMGLQRVWSNVATKQQQSVTQFFIFTYFTAFMLALFQSDCFLPIPVPCPEAFLGRHSKLLVEKMKKWLNGCRKEVSSFHFCSLDYCKILQAAPNVLCEGSLFSLIVHCCCEVMLRLIFIFFGELWEGYKEGRWSGRNSSLSLSAKRL